MHHIYVFLLNDFLTIKKIQNTQLRRKLNKVITSFNLRVQSISKTLYRKEGWMEEGGKYKVLGVYIVQYCKLKITNAVLLRSTFSYFLKKSVKLQESMQKYLVCFGLRFSQQIGLKVGPNVIIRKESIKILSTKIKWTLNPSQNTQDYF